MSRKSWDGVELMAALRSGFDRLESRVEEVNALNVFPVPDGDTGTNMLATLKAAIAEGDASLATGVTAIDEVSAAVARGALLGARGNSGVLLSQILRGLPQAVRGRQRARATEIAQSLSLGVLHAYSAVATPTEGTILTVAREVAAAAMKESEGALELRPFLERIAAAARISVEKTPTLLAVLREAGVVDSGGAGLQLILEGIANVPSVAPSRGTVEAERRSSTPPSSTPTVVAAPVDAAPTEFGYETVFILSSPTKPLDLAAIRAHLETIGESVLVAGDEVTCKVHVHNLRPDEVLAYGISLGDVRAVTIENLDQQSAERATGHAAFNQLADGPLTAAPRAAAASLGRGTSIVAVAAGAGLGDILRSAGASQIVHGGQTENPSAAEIASAIAHAGTEFVVVLPNNSNIVLAARQAADLSAANVVVIPTRNAAEGIAALLSWDPSLSLEELVPRMEAARAAARTFRVVAAVRDAVVRGVSVKAGQIMALDPVDGIIATGSSDVESIVAALAGQSAELITLYVGADVSDEQAAEFVNAVRGAIAGVEVDLQRGGQPIERVLVSLE
ncbi:MAG: DAK2 domain-containing protein [Chloroflexi bacterium]|nr:DAK2 domain-containing protein [Chloroflexota bacterium]MBJ7482954.1 DAK2 domain-containing protein [Chloroflexota bacterium]